MSHTNIQLPVDEVPIACTLTAAEYRQRVTDTGEVARAALVHRQPIPGGARLIFASDAEVHARLEGFVAAESECCPFLAMDLRRDDAGIVLDVTGPDGARPIIDELFT